MPRYSEKRQIGARPVAGIRSSAGRAAGLRPEHYMTKADSRSLNRDLDAALAAIEARTSPTPAHSRQPKVRTRCGMQDLNFRRFADGPL